MKSVYYISTINRLLIETLNAFFQVPHISQSTRYIMKLTDVLALDYVR